MHQTATAPAGKIYSLLDSLERGMWLPLPFAIMREAGSAVQTLGAIRQITRDETFVPHSTIAERAHLPLRTMRRHLDELLGCKVKCNCKGECKRRAAWIVNGGRQRTKRGAPRRTCTLSLTSKARDAFTVRSVDGNLAFGALPAWACLMTRHENHLSWPTRAILSVVIGRLMTLKGVAERLDRDASAPAHSIEDLGGADQFAFKLDYLEELTGLDRKSIVQAKEALEHDVGVISVVKGCYPSGNVRHSLVPDPRFRVRVSLSASGQFVSEFLKKKAGQ